MIYDTWLVELAKSINSESFVVPAYIAAASTAPTVLDPSTTVVTGEIGTRVSLTGVRGENEVVYTGVRTGASITNPTGDEIKLISMAASLINGTILDGIIIGGLVQTTAFDVEFLNTIEFRRR